jgi:hypothetical protein
MTAKRAMSTREQPPQFYACGICGAYHPATWDGDCRQDAFRFMSEELDEKYGSHGWEEVEMPGGEDEDAAPAVPQSKDAFTQTAVYDDGTFIRTALVIGTGDTGSIDLVDSEGVRIAQVNISLVRGYVEDGGEVLIVDTIDVDKRYARKMALCFSNGERRMLNVPEGGSLISADFRVK